MSEGTKNVVATEEGALSVKKLTFWEAAMIIVGANIGAGILGLAYSTRKAGWPILLMWLIVAGVCTTISMLYVAETTLRTKKPMQLPGLAERYLHQLDLCCPRIQRFDLLLHRSVRGPGAGPRPAS